MKKGLLLATTLLLGSAQSAWAHPGHGYAGTLDSTVHWLVSPDHSVVVVAVVLCAGIAAGVRSARRRTS